MVGLFGYSIGPHTVRLTCTCVVARPTLCVALGACWFGLCVCGVSWVAHGLCEPVDVARTRCARRVGYGPGGARVTTSPYGCRTAPHTRVGSRVAARRTDEDLSASSAYLAEPRGALAHGRVHLIPF